MFDNIDKKQCGLCCGGFSCFAIIFLSIIGLVIDSASDAIEIDDENLRDTYASNCFYAASIYCFCLILSLLCYCTKSNKDDHYLLNNNNNDNVKNQ